MKTPKIVFVGPVSPYRGGIAQTTDSLVAAFRNIADVHTISFRRQYPKVLYPGGSDRLEELSLQDDVEYILDSNSPVSLSRTVKRIIELNPDVVIISWWTLFWQPGFAYIATRLKKKGIKTIFYCHNIFDHDSPRWKQKLSTFFLKSASAYIVHTKGQEAILKEVLREVRVMRRPLPVFDHYPKLTGPKKVQKKGLKLLFFGFIRPYKGLDDLLAAMAQVKRKDVELKIVGESWTDTKEIEERAKGLPVKLDLRYVSDTEAAKLFMECDVVVLPYKKATGSAVIASAYFYGKPVIATKVEGLVDVVTDRTGWLIQANSPRKIAETIDLISTSEIPDKQKAIKDFCKENSWENMAKSIVKFVNTL